MEELLKKELGCKSVKSYGRDGSGCISSGAGFMTDSEGHIFAKVNKKHGARLMFDGEYESLKAIAATNSIRVPKPIKVFDDKKHGTVFVMEYLNMTGLGRQNAGKLGHLLARMHLHNTKIKDKSESMATSVHKQGEDVKYIEKFGFHVPTCCGFIPQDNSWIDDWVIFFSRQKLQLQVDKIINETGDRDVVEWWPRLQRKIPEYFKGLEITPALMHGDLWGGNAGELDGEPVVFDPASFYGHSEFDLGIASMFGGFSKMFYDEYFKLLPKQPGHSQRLGLYQMFHYLNHWNHFGTGYKDSSISLMKSLS
ncbi:ketosamine-3-kinase-like [Tubulanus polymorphus]|uniref:ketosamine-3-kinase-like n=1 Tax=Tubulanus polymorphus TaxID=672921 RepID=UPI003DA3DE33